MPIKTLVVDDSVLFRKALSEALGGFTVIELLGAAANGSIALKRMAQSPADLVFLDVHMGAMDFVQKPEGSDFQASIDELKQRLRGILSHVEVRLLSRGPGSGIRPASPVVAARPQVKTAVGGFAIVAVGVSTGGPEALARFIPSLPADFWLPIVMVQHMPAQFTRSLAESLSRKARLPVAEAQEGDAVLPGRILLAPGGTHLVVRREHGKLIAGLTADPPENSCRPAVDVLFRSVAAACGDSGVLAVVLTGMGSDGLAGVQALKKKKCYCITQSERSCVVYGMPRAIAEAGLSDESVDIDVMAVRVSEL